MPLSTVSVNIESKSNRRLDSTRPGATSETVIPNNNSDAAISTDVALDALDFTKGSCIR